jgi:hypothetical protein
VKLNPFFQNKLSVTSASVLASVWKSKTLLVEDVVANHLHLKLSDDFHLLTTLKRQLHNEVKTAIKLNSNDKSVIDNISMY